MKYINYKFMRPLILTIGFCLSIFNSIAQIGFFDVIGDSVALEQGEDVIELPNNNYVIAGLKYNSVSDTYGYIVEIDKDGHIIHQFIFNDPNHPNNDLGFNSICSLYGKYYSAGYNSNDSLGDNSCDISILSSDTIGNNNWNIKYGDTLINDIAKRIISDNKYLYTLGDKLLNYDPTLIKSDTNGNVVWIKSYGTPFMYGKLSKGLIQIEDSSFILVGDGNITSVAKDKWMIRTDKNGDTLFARIISNTGAGWVTNICKSYDTSVYLIGNSLSRYDYQGNLLADNFYPEFNVAFSMCKTNDSNYVVGGYIHHDFSLTKLDTSGNVIWSNTYDNNGKNDVLSKVIATSDGGYVMCGTSFFQGKQDILVIKVDSLGELHFATNINPITIDDNIILYPNPTNEIVFIKSSLPIETVNIYSMSGQFIKTKKRGKWVSISELSCGNYIVEVKAVDKYFRQRITKK